MRNLTRLSLVVTAGLIVCSTMAATPTMPPISTSTYKIVDVTIVDVENGITGQM